MVHKRENIQCERQGNNSIVVWIVSVFQCIQLRPFIAFHISSYEGKVFILCKTIVRQMHKQMREKNVNSHRVLKISLMGLLRMEKMEKKILNTL